MTDPKCCGACGYPVHATKEMACDWCRQAADRIEALTSERDELQLVVDKQGALLADAYGADLDWEEVLKQRADHEAVKRIEALTKERDEADDLAKAAFADGASNNIRLAETSYRVKWLEAKLAKAVKALEESVREFDCPIARATLAEIKGESHE